MDGKLNNEQEKFIWVRRKLREASNCYTTDRDGYWLPAFTDNQIQVMAEVLLEIILQKWPEEKKEEAQCSTVA